MIFSFSKAFSIATFIVSSTAQLADQSDYPVGPLTSSGTKWGVKVCDVTKYGAVADGKTDIGPALLAAFNACSSGGVVNIPAGTFAMATWVTLSGGTAWASAYKEAPYFELPTNKSVACITYALTPLPKREKIDSIPSKPCYIRQKLTSRSSTVNLEGTIVRTGTAGGNMIYIEHSTDFELYSSNGRGAMQGYGYVFHSEGTYGPRLLRLYDVNNFAVHDIALVDSPAFHLTLDTCNSGEVYNTIIRGGNEGGLDGIDLWGFNLWVHDVEVTNKDEVLTLI